MSSTAAPPEKFPLARLTVIPAKSKRGPRCHVRLAISHRLYWKAVNPDKDPAPTSLSDFRNQSSLALKRLPPTATWEDVKKEVAPYGKDGLSFKVSGRLHGRASWSTFSGEFSVVITADTTAERDKWMKEVRLRIAPPQALQERAKMLAEDDSASAASVASLTDDMKALFIRDGVGRHVDELKELPSELVDQVTSASSRTTRVATRIHSAVPNVNWIETINTQLKTWIDFVASAVKKGADTCEIVAGTAQDVADYAKFIPGGVSSVFQLVALSARLVVMFAEAGRGCRELPGILAKVMELLDCVAGSVVPILNPETTLVETKKILEGNVFDVLVATFDLVWKIEEQLMRSNWKRVINASVVKEIEGELTPLKQMVVSVALTEQVKDNKKQVAIVKEDLEEVKHDVSKVEEDLNEVKHEVGKVEEGLNEVKHDVGKVEEDLNEARNDVGKVEEDLDEVKHDVKKNCLWFLFSIPVLLIAVMFQMNRGYCFSKRTQTLKQRCFQINIAGCDKKTPCNQKHC